MASLFGRKVVAYKLNNSGGGVIAGDVVVPDTTANNAFTTTTSAAVVTGVWIADETIAAAATGRVVLSGHVTLVNVSASVTRGHTGTTHTVAKQAVSTGAVTRTVGTFCKFTTGGTTPEADIWPVDLLGSSLTNPMTAVGDMIQGGAAGAPVALAAVATGKVLISQGVTTAVAYGYPPFHGCRVTSSGNVALTSGSVIAITMDTESYDSDAMHFTSNANLTGTVAKNGTTAIVGTGTSFTTELSVGQVISVPGTAAEARVVTVITDNTHLTVATAFANTASGQTATRQNAYVVASIAGYYRVSALCAVTANPGAGAFIELFVNDAAIAVGPIPNDSVEGEGSVTTDIQLAQWDRVFVGVRVGAAAKNALANAYSPWLTLTLIGV